MNPTKYNPSFSEFILLIFLVFTSVQCKAVSNLSHTETIEIDMQKLPLPKRLAFMSGHVKAGIELYRLNELEMAGPHLMHPVSETHESERKDLDKLGFNQSLFVKISHALEKNIKSTEISKMLVEAEKNLDMISQNAGGDPYEIIKFLMAIALYEYELSFEDGTIIELGEYQDAWGFVEVSKDHAKRIPDIIKSKELIKEISALQKYWKEGPLPVERPTDPLILKQLIQNIVSLLNR